MKTKIDTAVICAAGLGSRLGLDTPKCLVKVGGRPLIYYLLNVLKDIKNIRIVVGFKEEDVIRYVKAIRKDVVFIRNKNYMSTTNSFSLFLGTRDIQTPFLNIDGDMFLTDDNFEKFYAQINEKEDLVAITKAYTEDAVFVKINEQNLVEQFSREKISNFEWTGIAYFANIKISEQGKYVYQEIEKQLPVKAIEIDCFEIDTPRDLEVLSNKIDFS
jgi:choline kinase